MVITDIIGRSLRGHAPPDTPPATGMRTKGLPKGGLSRLLDSTPTHPHMGLIPRGIAFCPSLYHPHGMGQDKLCAFGIIEGWYVGP